MFTPETGSLINLHRQELTQQAERHQLVRQARATRSGLETRVLVTLGGFLIVLGQRIQARYRLALSEDAGAVQLLPGQQADA